MMAWVVFFVFAVTTAHAAVDGAWLAKVQGKKGSREVVLNLKADGERLLGTMGRGGDGRAITDGKIEGDRISFTTLGRSKRRADTKMHWTARIEGNELKGTRQREGGKRSQPFTATRQQ